MSLIKIDADALLGRSQDIEKQIADLESISNRLNALIARIAASWVGEACDQYILLLNKYMKQIELMINVLQEFKKYAYNTAKEFSDLDTSAANRLRGAGGGFR